MFQGTTKKLERAEYFLKHLIALANEAGGLAYVLREKQQEMRATLDGFFFELISAKDFFLQAINDAYKLGLPRDEATNISTLKRCLSCKSCNEALSVVMQIEKELSNSTSVLWKINNYRNSATHMELLHMGFVASTNNGDVRLYLWDDPENPEKGDVSLKSALEFVNLKKPWIQKHLVRIKQLESQRQAVGSSMVIDKIKAKKKLTSRLHYLAEKHGLTYNKVTIRNQKTRWGSCSHKNNISLNMKLVLLPDELVDYVLLHELLHTRIHNHSKKFWVELDDYVGDGKLMAKKLKRYGLRLL